MILSTCSVYNFSSPIEIKMKSFARYAVVVTLFLCGFSGQAYSANFLSLSIGYFNTLDDADNEADFRAEYRPEKPIFLGIVKPWVGVEATSKASIWAGGGFLMDIKIADRLYLTPSFGIGFYNNGASNIDLSHPIQFRSQIEIHHIFQNDSRIGLGFSHLSNAGLGNHNSGAEVLSLYYTVPIEHFLAQIF
jgi:lipid A 3-O-deacylase